jgi:hypothetical protein
MRADGGGAYGTVRTSIDGDSPIFSEDATRMWRNMLAGQARLSADPRSNMKPFISPGRSIDEGTMAAAAPGIARGLSDVSMAAASAPLDDMFTNLQHQLGGQQARASEANSLAQLLGRLQDIQQYEELSNMNMASPILQQLMKQG